MHKTTEIPPSPLSNRFKPRKRFHLETFNRIPGANIRISHIVVVIVIHVNCVSSELNAFASITRKKRGKKKGRKIHIWTLLRTLMQREAVQSRSPIDDVWLHRVWPFILEADGLLFAGDHNFWSEPHCINTERWILMDECKHWISSITKFAVLAYVEDFGNFEIIVTYFVKRLW